jgi:tripartite-type tricarboxylate transporter receptor subunit TctC
MKTGSRVSRILVGCFGMLVAALTTQLAAQPNATTTAWPAKPISLIVTYPPGGGADAMARLIAPKMSEALGVQVVVENKAGASGQIAAAMVAKAPPDGYTLMLDASSFAVNPALYSKIPYDSEKAFKPIGVIALFPNVLLVNAQFAPKTVAELIALAKQKKGTIAYASSGNGSAQHLAGALFESAAGVDMVHVPYKGGGPALNDVIGGQVPVFFGNLASSAPHIQSGRLRALAITAGRRSGVLPDTLTLAEAGVVNAEVYEWNAIFAPTGTPETIVNKLAQALQLAMDNQEVKNRIAQLGGEIQKTNPESAKSFISQQISQWGKVVKLKGISVD